MSVGYCGSCRGNTRKGHVYTKGHRRAIMPAAKRLPKALPDWAFSTHHRDDGSRLGLEEADWNTVSDFMSLCRTAPRETIA